MYSAMSEGFSVPHEEYAGYIFDLDGTLVDSMVAHYRAWRMALAEQGAPEEVFRKPEFLAHGGCSAQDIVSSLNARYGLEMDADAVAARKRALYLELIESGSLEPIRETVEFARRMQGRVPMAIATGSAMPGALASLKSAGLEGLFELIVTPEMVERGKPFPDIFEEAARRMGVEPGCCLVFEDADPGIEAAKAAGMDWVRVPPSERLMDEE